MLTRAANGSITEIGQEYPGLFSGFSSALCMLDMDAPVQSFTNGNGQPLNQQRFEPLLKAM